MELVNQKLYHVLRVRPATELIEKLPPKFINRLKKRGRIQTESFTVYIKPLTHREYKIYSDNRYSKNVILKIFNNNLKFIDIQVSYVLKYSLLVKGIVDSVFTISGGKLEEMNTNPEILFDMLEGYRKTFTTMESLVDRFIIANAGIEMYMKYQELETIEERMALTALLEISTDIILEERWEMSRKIGGDVNLSFDKNFRK